MERRRELAEVIVKFHFGPLAYKVVHILILEGHKTLEVLVAKTDLAEDRVKESLRLLIQHNLVYFSMVGEAVHYHLIVQNIFVRLRFPKFSNLMKKRFPLTVCIVSAVTHNKGEIMVREIFTNGRMTRAQLVSKAKEQARKRSPHSDPPSEDDLLKEIDDAIKSQYLRLATAEIRDAVERDMKKQNREYETKSKNLSDKYVRY